MENKDKIITMLKEAYLEKEGKELDHEKAVDMCHGLDLLANKIFDDWIKKRNQQN